MELVILIFKCLKRHLKTQPITLGPFSNFTLRKILVQNIGVVFLPLNFH